MSVVRGAYLAFFGWKQGKKGSFQLLIKPCPLGANCYKRLLSGFLNYHWR